MDRAAKEFGQGPGESVKFCPGSLAVAAAELAGAIACAHAAGIPIFSLPSRAGAGREAFFDAVRAALPLDPPLLGNRSWDALSDSLFGGLLALGADRILLVWTNAARMVAVSPDEADTAMAVLADVAAMLAEPKFTQGRPVSLAVLAVTESP
ncbi:barstar family protein [Micromonospora sp. NPDC023737]|uniref:barstar family protein n=1 Tax=unclassified Micromonospora TaxID=2617518 RepID=UPI0033DB28A4